MSFSYREFSWSVLLLISLPVFLFSHSRTSIIQISGFLDWSSSFLFSSIFPVCFFFLLFFRKCHHFTFELFYWVFHFPIMVLIAKGALFPSLIFFFRAWHQVAVFWVFFFFNMGTISFLLPPCIANGSFFLLLCFLQCTLPQQLFLSVFWPLMHFHSEL